MGPAEVAGSARWRPAPAPPGARRRAGGDRLGRVRPPVQTLLLAVASYLFGLGAVRAAYVTAGHSNGTAYFALFWVGVLVVLASTVAVGLRRDCPDRLRWALLVAYGIFSFVPKALMSFSGPNYFDEFGHFRHARDIVAHGTLDISNSYLPIIKYYPGLETLTAAVHYVTRLSIWHSGQLVVVGAHVVALLAMWRLAVALGASRRSAFIAPMVFALNPGYMYFDTQYAYESLGLPLAMVGITFAVFARRSATTSRALGWSAATLLVGVATVFTHHVSAAFLSAALIGIALIVPAGRDGRPNRAAGAGPWLAALGVAATLTVWVTTVASPTIAYLQPHLQSALSGLQNLIFPQKKAAPPVPGVKTAAPTRHLFAGNDIPPYEVVCALLAPLVVLVTVAAAFLQAWWFRAARDAVRRRLPFLLLGLMYVASIPFDLTASGAESAHRFWPYAFVGIGICAVSADHVWRRLAERRFISHRRLRAVGMAALVVLAVGNVAVGEDALYRFPGPYTFGTDSRSQTPEVRALARWADAHIPPGTNVVTDRDTGEVIEGYTDLNVPGPNQSYVFRLYMEGDAATPNLRRYLAQQGFRYWILDRRIAVDTPKEKIFQGYIGPISVNGPALLQAGNSPFLQVIHRTRHYVVLAIHGG